MNGQPAITSRNRSGFFPAILRRVAAAPEGFLRPCSQSWRGRTETPNISANSASGLDFPDTVQDFLPDVPALFHLFEFLVRFGHFETPPSLASRYGVEDCRLWTWNTESATQTLPGRSGGNKSPEPRRAFLFPFGSIGVFEDRRIRESRLPIPGSTEEEFQALVFFLGQVIENETGEEGRLNNREYSPMIRQCRI